MWLLQWTSWGCPVVTSLTTGGQGYWMIQSRDTDSMLTRGDKH